MRITWHDGPVARAASIHSRRTRLPPKLAAAKLPHDQTRLQREMTATDRQIDALVYQLYDLTADEIALVEQTTN